MNDISAILAQIDSDAQKARESILANARMEADAIRREGEAQAEKESQRILKDARRQVEAVEQRTQSQIGIEGRNLRLTARRQVMDKVFDRAMELLCAMPASEKARFYARLAVESLEGEAVLVLNEEETQTVGPAVLDLLATGEAREALENAGAPAGIAGAIGQKLRAMKAAADLYRGVTLSETPGKFRGGFILRQGNIESNCTFEVLVAGVKEQMEAEVANVLF